MKEQILEPLLRKMRIRQVIPTIRQYPDCALLDVGCGWEARLLQTLEPEIGSGTGIDRVAPDITRQKIKTIQVDLEGAFPFKDDAFDVVTMLAVLEHLNQPVLTLREIRRVLKPAGALVITVPSHAAKPVLEFLAFRLKIVSAEQIADHKKYWNRADLKNAAMEVGLTMKVHRYFQLGFNNFAVLIK